MGLLCPKLDWGPEEELHNLGCMLGLTFSFSGEFSEENSSGELLHFEIVRKRAVPDRARG